MGFKRYVIIRGFNATVTLIIIAFLISVLFIGTLDQIIKAQILGEVQAYVREHQREFAGMSPEEREQAIKEYENRLIKKYGLDQPIIIRIFIYTWRILTLDFGNAVRMRTAAGSQKVMDIIIERLPRTVILFTTAEIFVILFGVFIGLRAARQAGSSLDRGISIFALITNSLPMWWFGMLMILLFSYYLNLFPSGGFVSLPPPTDPLGIFLDFLWHLTLPLLTVFFISFGGFAYVVRNIVLETLQEDFVMAARAKGVPEHKVIYGHVLRTAAPPIITMSLLGIVVSLSGAIITETVFSWPGMGLAYWIAIEQGDVPVLLGLTYVTTIVFIIAMVLADILYGILDPRIRVGGG
ncbi:MAG: ABC transporter permease [Candidatus Baldrarchaeia archaeon]